MDPIVLKELARSWYAQAEEPPDEDGSDDPKVVEARGYFKGKRAQFTECAEQLEAVLKLYGPLLHS